MVLVLIVFWLSLILLFYSYLGYGLVIWFYLKLKRLVSAKKPDNEVLSLYIPPVTLIIATYNEESIVEKKIENTLNINYPNDKLRIIFVADGSNDNTVSIIKKFPQIELFYQPERRGKSAAINRIMPLVTTPVTVFSDANTFLNPGAIREIVKHYIDPLIGGVAGEKKVVDLSKSSSTAGAGEGLYWKYESLLKKLDARFYSVVGAAGELFSIRTELFEPVAEHVLLDDFVISMKICMRGYKVMYEPKAFATEGPSYSMKDEQNRKIRIAAGGFQSVLMLKGLLNIFKFGKLSFLYISHRVLRWLVCPLLLPILMVTNFLIYFEGKSAFYLVLLLFQVLFYTLAISGWLFVLKNIKIKLLYIPYYFLFMNLSMYLGFHRYVTKTQSVLWDKVNRKT